MNRWQEPADQAAGQMLKLHLDNLKLRFGLIAEELLDSRPREKRFYVQIQSALRDEQKLTWDDAFHIESQIGCLLEADRLRQEIQSRLRWAATDGVPHAAVLEQDYAALLRAIEEKKFSKPEEALRDFWLRLMEHVHWHSKRKYLSRKVRGQATRRTLLIGLAALALTLLPYFVVLSCAQAPAAGRASVALLHYAQVSTLPASQGTEFWVHFALYTSLAFGFLGALFSRLITLQRQWSAMALDELYNARSYHYIILRASIGVLGALVVFFFLQSGLVTGAVFPDFSKLSLKFVEVAKDAGWPSKLLLPSPSLALLIMWSFIAGFSESLVPTVLSRTEGQLGSAITPRQ